MVGGSESEIVQTARQFHGQVFGNAQKVKLPPLHWSRKTTMDERGIDKIDKACIKFLQISLQLERSQG